jgi:hypothetical protein
MSHPNEGELILSDKQLLGMYRGEVVNDQDPKGAGRVRVNVFNVFDDIPHDSLPWAIYSDPFMGGQTDLGGLFVPDVGSHVWVFFEQGDPKMPVYCAGAPARPHGPSEAKNVGQYPRNKVFKTKQGHTIEFDDSDDNTRVRIAHGPSGTQKTYAHNGDAEEVVQGGLTIIVEQDAVLYVKGNCQETVEGNLTRSIKGNVREVIGGDLVQFISGNAKRSSMGRITEVSGGGSEYSTTANMNISGSRVDINKGDGASVTVVEGTFVYTIEYAYSYSAAKPLVDAAGTNAPFDTPEDADLKAESISSGEFPEEEDGVMGDEVETDDAVVQQLDPSCPVVLSDKYQTPVGGLTVRDLTLSPIFPHPLQAQKGLTEAELICNAHHLMVNVGDPLMNQFPEFRINSAFRRGESNSQHNSFMALDLQSTTRPGDKAFHRNVLDWISSNIPYDQVIIETSNGGNSYWIHISYDRNKASQRKSRLTYINGSYTSGWNV